MTAPDRIAADRLTDFATAVYAATGVPEPDARLAAPVEGDEVGDAVAGEVGRDEDFGDLVPALLAHHRALLEGRQAAGRDHHAASVGRPPDESLDVTGLIEEIVAEAHDRGVAGQAVTPYVLVALHERSGGETRRVNRDLIVANAGLAAEIAVAYASL